MKVTGTGPTKAPPISARNISSDGYRGVSA